MAREHPRSAALRAALHVNTEGQVAFPETSLSPGAVSAHHPASELSRGCLGHARVHSRQSKQGREQRSPKGQNSVRTGDLSPASAGEPPNTRPEVEQGRAPLVTRLPSADALSRCQSLGEAGYGAVSKGDAGGAGF